MRDSHQYFFQVFSTTNNHARHNIFVDGIKATYFEERDPGVNEQTGATSIVMKLVVGQQVNVAMWTTGGNTLIDNTPPSGNHIFSWFEAALLHLD